ncbi:hypothetical protein C8R43DRAFT_994221 [Mycena crocata]|nr:hypothetical protein C8R43DRAFT_994221 [Mycena crocata]
MAFTLTAEHVHSILDPVTEKFDFAPFMNAVDPSLRWIIGSEKKDPVRKTGVYSLESWLAEVRGPLDARLKPGFEPSWGDIDIFGNKAIIECRGRGVQLNGNPYDNRYVWIFIFSEAGKIIEIREYLDTALVQEVFQTNDV